MTRAIETKVRAQAKQLRSASATMQPAARLGVMRALMSGFAGSMHFGQMPEPTHLTRLAAHCIVWAEELERQGAKQDTNAPYRSSL